MAQPLVGLLDVLQDDDSLRSALLGTPASDHVTLRQTCSRIREIIDSPIFAQERSEQGFAEVSVSLMSAWEHYKRDHLDNSDDDDSTSFDEQYYNQFGSIEEYGNTSSEATIFVDGKRAGEIHMQLLPLHSHCNFHEIGDSISGELQEISLLFFTQRGKPTRVRSVKKAYQEFLAQKHPLAGVDDDNFLYITKFELEAPYRTTSNIGALALRHLLLKTAFKDKWTLAMYIPYGETQMTMDEQMDQKYAVPRTPDERPTEKWMTLFRTKTIQDMRQFLRAGFAQVKETVLDTSLYHVFCVPSFLEEELLSHDQQLAIPIITRPYPPPKRSEDAQQLLEFMKRSCISRHYKAQTIMSWRVPVLEHPLMQFVAHQHEELAQMQVQLQELESVIAMQPSEQLEELLDTMMVKVEDFLQILEPIKEEFRTMARNTIETLEQELEEFDTTVQSKVTQSVEQFGYDIIVQSNIIQACASNLECSYIEMLMGVLPPDQKVQAINEFDQKGVTPLMLAAGKTVDARDKQLQTCRLLLNLDANKDIVDASGMTALGRFRDSTRTNNDFINCLMPAFAEEEQDATEDHNDQMEVLLTPSNGPTEEDDAILEDEPPDSSEDDGLWDDMDEDDDDDDDDDNEDDDDDAED